MLTKTTVMAISGCIHQTPRAVRNRYSRRHWFWLKDALPEAGASRILKQHIMYVVIA